MIVQAYVNQAYNLLRCQQNLDVRSNQISVLIFLSSLIEMVASTERSSIYQFTEHVAKCLMI